MNKKAIARSFFWVVRIGFILIPMIIFLVIVSNRFIGARTDPGSTEYDLLINRIYKTFGYTSPNTGRTYPYIFDQKKFKEKVINDSILTQKDVAVKVILNNSFIYFNKEFYDIGKPLAKLKGAYKEISHISPVQILTKDNKIVSGIINISIIYYKT